MAVIGAVVGVGAVYKIAVTDPYSDYNDYSNYSNYDNYSNYSDAVERRRRRQEEKNKEITGKKYEINTYKNQSVNKHLQSYKLIEQPGVDVSLAAVKNDGNKKIKDEEDKSIEQESGSLQKELEQIDALISKIDTILEENENGYDK